MTVVEWLLDSYLSIRWQVMRDLTDEPDDARPAEPQQAPHRLAKSLPSPS